MSKIYDVAVLVGSLRKESFTRKTVKALVEIAPASLKLSLIEIGALALYNEDLEAQPPESWLAFRKQLKTADAFLFATPEYNRSLPAVLKNAIDVGSRPYGRSVFSKKPGAVLSVSPGAIGGFGANHHLRQSMVFLDVPMLQQPEAYIAGAADLFDATGRLKNDKTRELLSKFIQAFAAWIARNGSDA